MATMAGIIRARNDNLRDEILECWDDAERIYENFTEEGIRHVLNECKQLLAILELRRDIDALETELKWRRQKREKSNEEAKTPPPSGLNGSGQAHGNA